VLVRCVCGGGVRALVGGRGVEWGLRADGGILGG